MPEPDLAEEVDSIITIGQVDPESAHSREDELLRRLCHIYAPAWVRAELERLAAAPHDRWCA